MSEDLTELLARVEAATGPDAVLDRLVVEACKADGLCRECWGLGGEHIRGDGRRCDRCQRTYADAVTGSLDCALALVERLLPRWDIQLTLLATLGPQDNRTPRNRVVLLSNSDDTLIDGDGATPALALLAAMLTALTQQKDPR